MNAMNFRFLSEPTFETWDWTNPALVGIGGSETSHIEMAQRLAARGHRVTSYAPVGFEGWRTDPYGVIWMHSKYLDEKTAIVPFQAALRDRGMEFLLDVFSRAKEIVPEPNTWIVYRAPHLVDDLPEDAVVWLICQDVDYPKQLTERRAKRFTRIVALCETHAAYLKARYPFVADRVFVSSNGIKTELIAELDAVRPRRNPKRLMYASSPDRGMEFLLDVFSRAKEIVPDLELHLYYGFDNIDKLKSEGIRKNAERLKAMIERPGVVNHGRTPQPKLISEWFKAGIWCHPSNFTETSCITSMDAQACGAIPITRPVWAIGENVKHGVFIEGDVTNDLVRSRYVTEVVKLALDPDRQEEIRREMTPYARERFGWAKFVDQWEAWADVRAEVAA